MTVVDSPVARARDTNRKVWDAIVVGAGPAGALAARQIARAGFHTLLVDSKHFPREKVCGGYLNRRALETLQQVGLAAFVPDNPRTEVRELNLMNGRQQARFELPAGRVICRTEFDTALIEAAKAEGAEVLTGVQAVVEPRPHGNVREVTLVSSESRNTAYARVVVCADGLARKSVRQLPEFASTVSAVSRVGIGGVVRDSTNMCSDGRLTMVISRRGYVGISRIDEAHLNIAAAIEPVLLSQAAPAEIVASILATASIAPPANLATATWRGTPPLTSRPRCVAADRVFLIGDAGGYVEPFTGEGMAAALESAVSVTPFVLQASEAWTANIETGWRVVHREIVSDRQHTCRTLAWILRRPWATFATMSTCRAMPAVATRWISKTTSPTCLNGKVSAGIP